MGIVIGLIQQIRTWDRSSKVALGLALAMVFVTSIALLTLPQVSTPALMGFVGAIVAVQVVVLYGNRNLVTPYTLAQRQFIAGEMAQARDTLLAYFEERQAEGKRPDVDTHVLLGNIYRNLGELAESETMLQQANRLRENYHFALYGLGRTALAQGDYETAIRHIEKALQTGAPTVVRFDLAHACFRLSDDERAIAILQDTPQTAESYRQLMMAFILHVVGGAPPPATHLIEQGLPFWEAEASRFADTPYGKAIQQDIATLHELRNTGL